MGLFQKQINTIKELEALINPTIQEVMLKEGMILKEIQTDVQLYDRGERSDESIITPGYTRFTIQIKQEKGQPTDRVTLRDTGRFHKSLKFDVGPEQVVISSSVPYAKELFEKYGDNILGIQTEFLEQFVNTYIYPQIRERFNGHINAST